MVRDRRVNEVLRAGGQNVLRTWEHEVRQDVVTAAEGILRIVRGANVHG
jgi:very-short-patch-repair endonuclease